MTDAEWNALVPLLRRYEQLRIDAAIERLTRELSELDAEG